ncbi:DUF58 domain-containing protein [Alkalihalobacillus sp. LMS39]|uniref:DUF58 domain-containing protein n=1 Tax=Alkalihalobacillus sp. LMS39 TaxID=2924032 RepID=UPI001FB34E51|nr:DUF58 domain-containing protein [Alkalihalobacillus sp. LMS39]UOE94629.1 DUF58 domain-containing protein [Alkalihalobacillus sp. LMS39]
MNWTEEVIVPKVYHYLMWCIPLLGLFVIFSKSPWLFSLFVLLSFFLWLNSTYVKKMRHFVSIPTKKTTVRMFPGDEDTLSIPLGNQSFLPVSYAEMTFFIYDPDESIEMVGQTKNMQSVYKYPVVIPSKKHIIHKTRIKAVKRGVVQLRTIELELFDFCKLGKNRLQYRGGFRGEMIVYPSLKPVSGLANITVQTRGERPAKHSLHEDIMSIRGTRSYVSSDPFNRINWKASAKTTELQTKLYEMTTITKWCFLVNLKNPHHNNQMVDNLEQIISHLAFACHYATKQHIAYEIYLNIRSVTNPVVYLPYGTGKEQLAKVLEILARVNTNAMVTSSIEMMHYARKNQNEQNIFLYVGPITGEEGSELRTWMKKGATVYHIRSEEEVGQVVTIGGGQDGVAEFK